MEHVVLVCMEETTETTKATGSHGSCECLQAAEQASEIEPPDIAATWFGGGVTNEDIVEAFYGMKRAKHDYIDENKRDDASLQVLEGFATYRFQLDLLVKKFLSKSWSYPDPDFLTSLIAEIQNDETGYHHT